MSVPSKDKEKNLMIDKYFFNRSLNYKKKHEPLRKYVQPSNLWTRNNTATYTSGFNNTNHSNSNANKS